MTHPDRIRRGHAAQHRGTPRQPPHRPLRRPAQDPVASTSLDHTAANPSELADRAASQRPYHGITRPPRGNSSGEVATSTDDPSRLASDDAPTHPLLHTAEQAAQLLQVRPSWLRRKAAARAVPCRFLGKHLRFSRADIELIAQNSAAPPQHSS
ncbi:helix-turn-helix domain-containing protein [Actinophytocola glycyrrhizae]|uniref:Helix-turn-helix domain-containing protein n=1 Tax=Actinophytocola glycyrrhizae TaxID=2044873 RepID=A0ABV9S8X4_9PSEU